MENLHYNLSEEEFSRGRKMLLWGFAALFFLAGIYILFVNLVLGQRSISVIYSIAPLGIGLVVGVIAGFATFKGTDLFFAITSEKVEYKFGVLKPVIHSFTWDNIRELEMPRKQKKIRLLFKDGSAFDINLNWVQRKKSSLIRKNMYYAAREKNLNVVKVVTLKNKG